MPFGRKISAEESIQRLAKADPGKNGNAALAESVNESSGLAVRFESRLPKFKMSDVILPDSVRLEIRILKSRMRNHELIYRDWGFESVDPRGANIAVSFYGEPGTGKTMCAEALAADLGQPILEINYAEIESKYVGDTPKNIVAAFAAAKQARAVLFFDEADSILGRRLTNVTQSADHGVNVSRSVMLKQLDQFEGIVIFATNLARNFDTAFVRRILQHIHVPVPDEACRLLLWQKMIPAKVPGRESVDFSKLAQESEAMTGGLIKNAALLALSELAECLPGDRKLATDSVHRAMIKVRRAHEEVGGMPVARSGLSNGE
jgi:SpoVK/Ycf46/Vps4 family AAA+-type ATPase